MLDQQPPEYSELLLYNGVLFIGFIWFFKKYNRSSLLMLIITLFFGGLIMDFGNQLVGKIIFGTIKRSNIGFSIWQIGTLIWALKIFYKYYPLQILKKHRLLIIIFLVYSIYFVVDSLFINQDSILLFLREFSKDLIPFLLFFVIVKIMQDPNIANKLNHLFLRLLIAQIIFSVAKLIILLRPYEGLVGSLTGLTNGGPGTTLALLGLIYLAINTKMSLNNKDFWVIIGLLFTGFLAGKRAIVLVFPILFMMLSTYVYHRRILLKIIVVAMFLPLFLYVAIKLSPTLNPENEVWGSFDPEYAWKYGLEYSTGKNDKSDDVIEGYGRVGALALAFNQIKEVNIRTNKMLFGYGLEYLQLSNDNYFDSNHWWGISGRGAITGILYKYFSIGLIGAILYTLFIILLVSNVKNKRLKFVIITLVLFDFIFYNATIITFPSLFVLLIFGMSYDGSIIKNTMKEELQKPTLIIRYKHQK